MRDILQVFKALSDETRLRILCLLLQNELCVCELIDILGMTQSRISHQLQILKNAQLVHDRREGKWIIYSLNRRNGHPYRSQMFDLLKMVLVEEKVIQNDARRLKGCLKANVRDRCQRIEVSGG